MKIKEMIIEALKLQNGLRSRELIEYICSANPNVSPQGVYSALNVAMSRGDLVKDGHVYTLANREAYANGKHPAAVAIRPLPATEQKTNQLATFQQGRKSKQVMIVSSPQYYEDIVRIELLHEGGSFIVPMFGGITICTGPDIPKLSPDQESYRGVRSVRLTFRNGKCENINTNGSGHVTVAPME